MKQPCCLCHAAGFTLLELSLVLSCLIVFLSFGIRTWTGVAETRRQVAIHQQEQLIRECYLLTLQQSCSHKTFRLPSTQELPSRCVIEPKTVVTVRAIQPAVRSCAQLALIDNDWLLEIHIRMPDGRQQQMRLSPAEVAAVACR